jgi:hypothetical protein
LSKRREFPDWMYPYPDARTTEIVRLKAELKECNDLIVTLTELIRCEFGLIAKDKNRERKAE